MRLRTSTHDRTTAASGPESAADSSPTGGLARRILVAAGILVLAYAVSRFLDSRDAIPAVDEIRERAAETVPDEVQNRAVDAVPDDRIETIRNRTGQTVPDDITEISIEGPRSEKSETEPDLESSTETTEVSDDGSDVTGLDEPDVQDEPVEPGEMALDEDVADNSVDDDLEVESNEDDESAE